MKKSDKILDPFFKVVPSMAQLMQVWKIVKEMFISFLFF